MASAPLTFHERIETALSNPVLQVALDRNAARRIPARNQRFAELPDSEAVRDRGRAIRLETLSRLDHYLTQFAANVEQNGGSVHWAATAADARRLILEIVRNSSLTPGPSPKGRGVEGALPLSQRERGLGGEGKVVAKSKSMISEEIHLNAALEAEGVRVVETDLGEWIVQLRGEPPAHIITPAVHLRREEVSELFHERFGMEPTLDVEKMTALAQRELRQVYYQADVGITGVNFGVAECGAIAIVTNEGNADLSKDVPRIHIALMGIERLVPTLADLEVMLRLLPRSATAQKLTSYVSLVSGPRKPEEPDGPEEFHVILVDNGRSRMLGTDLAESLLCLRCGACFNICPVFRELGGHAYGTPYGGPIGSLVSPALFGSEFNELAHASTLCGACRDICPVRIDIPTMLLAVRQRSVCEGQAPLWLSAGLKAWAVAMTSPALYESGQFFAALGSGLLAQDGQIHHLPPPLDAWTNCRDFPAFAKDTFRARWRRRKNQN